MVATDVASRGIGMYPSTTPPLHSPFPPLPLPNVPSNYQHMYACAVLLLLCLGLS